MLRKYLGMYLRGSRTDDQHEETYLKLPLFAVEEILLNVPAQQVVSVCSLVCSEWKSVVDSTAFWKERCRREGLKLNCPTKIPRHVQAFYFLCKKRRNLLKNPNAEEQFNDWQITENGGNRWITENVFSPHPNEAVTKCFVTSYNTCMKQQLIDLAKEGYSQALMDDIHPDIVISDWYAPRWDCGSVYEICVELLDRRKKVIKRFQPAPVTFEQWNDSQWKHLTYVFKDYRPGVCFVRFTHGGKDTQFWAGHYGIRVTNSSVEILPASEE